MTTQEALHAAIAGGWDFKKAEIGGVLTSQMAFIDPLFWEALGKALGWDGLNKATLNQDGRLAWHQMWVTFIDHLAHGKTPEEFFQKLA
jgi:hypothetical protein